MQLRFQATRAAKAKFDWKKKNEKSMLEYKKIKYLLLILMTIYVPVTRNAMQMIVCAPKYGYDQYKCTPNGTDTTGTDLVYSDSSLIRGSPLLINELCSEVLEGEYEGELVEKMAFPQGCFQGNHYPFVFLSVLVILLFTLAFPIMISKVVSSMIPKPAHAADDPEHPCAHPPQGDPEDGEYQKRKEMYDKLHGKAVVYDDNGKLVEYTNKIFLMEVRKNRHNPYASIYTGFEQQWANYKAIIMGMKFLQLLPTVFLTSSLIGPRLNGGKINVTGGGRDMAEVVGSACAALIMLLFLMLACKASPYVDPINDRMDHVSRSVLFATPVIAILSNFTGSNLEFLWSIILNLSAAASALFSLMAMIYVMACFQTKLKGLTGNLAFSDPNGITKWSDASTLPDWDLDVERKRRVWKPFWDQIFKNDPELSATAVHGAVGDKNAEGKTEEGKEKDDKKKKKRRKTCVRSVDGTPLPYPSTRLEEMLAHLRIRGFDAWESGLMPVSPQDAKLRLEFQTLFEGPDIFCDDRWVTDPSSSAVKDGKLDSRNGFGRLEVEPFPFCLKIYWDGKGKDFGELPSWGHHWPRINELWNMQLRPEVQRMKGMRVAIRGMAASGQLFDLEQHRTTTESKKVPDGKDEDGNQKYRTETITIHWTYHNGRVNVAGDYGNSPWEQGFNVSMTYNDGVGIASDGTTRHGSHTFMASDMGIDHSNYNLTPKFSHLLGRDGHAMNAANTANGVQAYNVSLSAMRKSLLLERFWDNYQLSWGFWYHVYNNDVQSQEQLMAYFSGVAKGPRGSGASVSEQNPAVQNIATKYAQEIEAVCAMIKHFNQNPAVAYWYVYWHDVWKQNSDIAAIKANAEVFDSCNSDSICYRPMGRDELEKFLGGLSPANPLGKKQSGQLDLLYSAIEEVTRKHAPIRGNQPSGDPAASTEIDVQVPPADADGDGSVEMAPIVGENKEAPEDDGSAVFVDFAKNPVNPKSQVVVQTVVSEFEGAVFVDADKNPVN